MRERPPRAARVALRPPARPGSARRIRSDQRVRPRRAAAGSAWGSNKSTSKDGKAATAPPVAGTPPHPLARPAPARAPDTRALARRRARGHERRLLTPVRRRRRPSPLRPLRPPVPHVLPRPAARGGARRGVGVPSAQARAQQRLQGAGRARRAAGGGLEPAEPGRDALPPAARRPRPGQVPGRRARPAHSGGHEEGARGRLRSVRHDGGGAVGTRAVLGGGGARAARLRPPPRHRRVPLRAPLQRAGPPRAPPPSNPPSTLPQPSLFHPPDLPPSTFPPSPRRCSRTSICAGTTSASPSSR